MRNNNNTPRVGMIIALCVTLAAIWLVAVYGTYKETTVDKYSVRVRPGAVTYGTHSTAPVPMVTIPARHSVAPMISGAAVRHYAYNGHSTPSAPTAGNGYRIHTASSATLHSIGSGGGGGGGIGGGPTGGSSSSRNVTYGSASVSIPSLAMVAPAYSTGRTASTETTAAAGPRLRKAKPGDEDGEEGDWTDGGEGDWWYKTEDGWTAVVDGDTRYDALLGYTVIWNGSTWVKVSEYEPGTPIGSTPWLLFLLLAAGYAFLPKMGKKSIVLDKK